MRNYVQPGDVITVPASADIEAGDLVVIGSLVGVAAADAKSGNHVSLKTTGIFNMPKVSAQAWTIGAPIYWDGSVATTVSTDNDLIGVAVAVAANPSPSGQVRLSS
ncbi:DUF2190 family protein [Amorphus orientalis]|uniref:RecA/RadA family phage recombinase n=1 Tax=Amorphus orientalis TaxID=649198 RepID=A0AAE3VNV3_9HYPH|nr:DUF2190 family protein [Amorphus orientalis]MDQ0315512.1 putative RecA/RadA family phage recombinase [Amorphus orientalis]